MNVSKDKVVQHARDILFLARLAEKRGAEFPTSVAQAFYAYHMSDSLGAAEDIESMPLHSLNHVGRLYADASCAARMARAERDAIESQGD